MKKIPLIIAILLCFSTAWAQDFYEVSNGDTIYYTITSYASPYGVAVTSVIKSQNSDSVTIPSSVTYYGLTYSVTSIGDTAFYACTGLTSITIPNSVTRIGNYAFSGCSRLTSVTIPNSVSTIGTYAFYLMPNINYHGSATGSPWGALCVNGYYYDSLYYSDTSKTTLCSAHKQIHKAVIPNTVTSIRKSAFEKCGSLTSVTIDTSVTRIGEYAFYGCTGLTSVTIPNSVTSIGEYVFCGCTGLTSATIGLSVGNYAFYGCSGLISVNILSAYRIGNSAFSGCSRLTSVTIPNSVTSIGNNAFSGCTGLTSITIPNSVISIGNSAFNGCRGLTSVTIPDSVTSIGYYAFSRCSGLTSVTIGRAVESIEYCAFAGDSNLTTVYFNADSCIYSGSYNYNNNNGYHYVFDECGISTLIIGNNVKIIPSNAFRQCSTLTSVTIGNSVTSIGDYAFADCTGLTSVPIFSVTSIGDYAFIRCSGLTSATLSAYSIGKGAFADCSGLTSATILSAYIIGEYAFSGDTSLTSININSVRHIGNKAFYHCSSLTSVTIPNSAYSIGNCAFENCGSLSSVTIGNSVTSIGYSAFESCSSLTSVTIPNSVTSIGNFAFSDCSGLTSVTIGNHVRSIGNYAFSSCSGLTSVTIPNSVRKIGNNAFEYCGSLTSVTIGGAVDSMGESVFYNDRVDTLYYNATNLRYLGNYVAGHTFRNTLNRCTINTITIGNNVRKIPTVMFNDCSGPSRTNYTGTIAQWCNIDFNSYAANPISYSHNLYINNQLVTNLVIPNTVDTIKQRAFYGDTCITSVTIPNSVTSIENSAFSGCTGITSVTMRRRSTTIGNYAFSGVSTSIPVYVPCGALAWYRNQLSGFSNFIEIQYEYHLSSHDNVKGTVATVTAPTCNSSSWTICATPNYGYTFSHWSDGDTMNPRNITLTKDTNIIAFFTPIYYNVALSANDTNIGSVSGSGIFAYLSQDTLTATANTGYVFTRWNDGNTQNPRVITVVQDTIFTAYFAVEHNVIVHSNDSTKGSVSGSGRFANLSQDTLTATAETGYTFTRWNDGNKQNPRVITVTQDTIFTAYFAVAHNVVVHSDDSTKGSVSGSGIFGYLTQDTLTATANTGYVFSQWNDGNTSNPRIITVTQDTAFTAFFSPNYYNVTVLPNDTAMGTVSGSGRFAYLSKDTITATPNTGYIFSRWSDGNNQNTRIITVRQNITVTAIFYLDPNYYNVTVSSNDTAMGTVTGNGRFAYLSQDTITATANTGYTFSRWSDGNTQNPRSITVTQDTILIAFFTSNQGIAETENTSITLYPNPASDKVTLEGVGNEANIFIINAMGKVVRRLENAGGTLTFSVGDLPKGIYFVRVGNAVRKLVID